MKGRLSPKSPQRSDRLRNAGNPIQSAVFVTHVVVSLHKSVISSRVVGLILLIGSIVAFTTALGLESLVFSQQIWTKLSVGAVLVMVMLLISWCVWTTMQGWTDFSVVGTFYGLKNRLVHFTMGLRDEAIVPQPDVVDNEDGGGH